MTLVFGVNLKNDGPNSSLGKRLFKYFENLLRKYQT